MKYYHRTMGYLYGKKERKGSAAAEAAIVLPLILLLVISVMMMIVKISCEEIEYTEYDLTSEIRTYDGIKRKGDIIFETFFK